MNQIKTKILGDSFYIDENLGWSIKLVVQMLVRYINFFEDQIAQSMGTERLLFVIGDLFIFQYQLSNIIEPKIYNLSKRHEAISSLLELVHKRHLKMTNNCMDFIC